MKSNKHENDPSAVIWTKLGVSILILLTCVTSFFFIPLRVFDSNTPHILATSLAITSEDNMLLYDYKVYSTQARFEMGLVEDVNKVVSTFKERNEVLAVAIFGETQFYETRDDYLLIQSPDVPELNIEYRLVKNLAILETSLPCRTFIMLLQDIIKVINTIYLITLIMCAFLVIAPASIKISKYVIIIAKNKEIPLI